MQLIGLAGKARSGKDTVAALLSHRGFLAYSFADPIRAGLREMLGLTYEQLHGTEKEQPLDWLDGVSPRQLMQTLGTEWGRFCVHPDVWLRLAQREWQTISSAYTGCPGLAISDVRFENEARWIRSEGGEIWHIRRSAAAAVSEHVSEDGVDLVPGDREIDNNGTLDELAEKVRGWVKHLRDSRCCARAGGVE